MSSRRRQLAEPAVQIELRHRPQAQVIDMETYRIRLEAIDRDSIINALWNEMTRLTHEAWTWRDPESIEALEFHIANLKAHVLEEWRR